MAVLAFVLACALFCGCGVTMANVQSGQSFNHDNVLSIRRGMHDNVVLSLLGTPFGVGVKKDGNIFYTYDWTEYRIQSVYGGILLVGGNRRVTASGYAIDLELDPATRTVKSFEYKIVGQDNYDRLRRGRHE